MKQLSTLIVIMAALLLIVGGCTHQIEKPTQTDRVAGAPEIPRNLQTLVGDAQISLSWEVSDPSNIERYFVYRGDTTGSQTELLDSTAELTYTDTQLRNSLRYIYQVSALGKNALEGKRSASVSATPNIFSVAIAEAAKFTKTVDVILNLTAPTGTRLVYIANDSLFTGSSWQAFSASKNWRLTNGEGEKHVYARFRDLEGNETSSFYSDDIILDSRAAILSVTENSNGQLLAAGDIVHFSLQAGESDGVATVDIPGLGTINLYDDYPLSESPLGDDGTYEADYVIPGGVDVIDGTVSGNFADAAGNRALLRAAATFLNVANPPEPSQLSSFAVSETELELSWTKSGATDFAGYQLFRTTSTSVDSTSTLVKTETNPGTTSFRDTDVKTGVTYRYALYTVDKSGLMSKSNVLTAQTVSSPPAAVTLSAYVVSESEVELDWSRSTAIDFASYQLFRSDDANVTTSSTLLQTQTTSTTTTYRDTDRKPATDYYYAVFTVDKAGLSAKSNVVKVTTAENLRPDSVTLFISKRDSIPASVTLGWTKNGDKDFESYRVYRSDSQGSAGKLITAVTAQSTTQYLDNGIDRRNTYYYTVIVYDKYGMASKVSNEVISGPN